MLEEQWWPTSHQETRRYWEEARWPLLQLPATWIQMNRCDRCWSNNNPQLDEVSMAGVTLQHGHEWLGADLEYITIVDIETNMMTEAFTTVKMPADTGPNWLGRVHCKVDTSAGGNVMPLQCVPEVFPSWLDTDGKPTGLCPTVTQLTAYNGSAIPQLGAHDTAMEWRPSSSGPSRCVHTQWYIADTSGPAILGLPSSLKLGVIQLNCAIQFACKWEDTPNLPRRPTTEHGKVTGDLLHLQKSAAQHRWSPLPPLNSSKGLIAAYPNHFEGIGCFPWMYTIHLHEDAKPVIHAPHKCPIAVHPLVHEKLDEFIEQEIIVPVTEPTDWVLLTGLFLEGQWKTMGLFRPQGSQCCYLPWPLPYPNPGWDHSWAWW